MFVRNGIGCQFRVHPILVPEVPAVPLPLASGSSGGAVFLADSPPLSWSLAPVASFSLGGLGQVTSHLGAPVCPVTRGFDALSGGLQGAGCGEHFLAPHVMVKHTVACLLGRQERDREHRVLLSRSMLPSSPQVCLPNSAPPGSGPSLSPDQNPVSALAPPSAPLSPPASQAVSCVCLCVGTSPISALGIFGKGWWGGPIQESSGLPP